MSAASDAGNALPVGLNFVLLHVRSPVFRVCVCFTQVSEGLADLFPRLLADLLVPAAAGAKGGDDEKQAESHMSDKAVRFVLSHDCCVQQALCFVCQRSRFSSAI